MKQPEPASRYSIENPSRLVGRLREACFPLNDQTLIREAALCIEQIAGEWDAMKRRAESAESDWQILEARVEKIKALGVSQAALDLLNHGHAAAVSERGAIIEECAKLLIDSYNMTPKNFHAVHGFWPASTASGTLYLYRERSK